MSETPRISIVMPVRNEAGNVGPLLEEIAAVMAAEPSFEVVVVDDGSSDGTAQALRTALTVHSFLRAVRHPVSCGQSAAIRTGVRQARGQVVVTIDGDGQNDPAYIPALVAALDAAGPRAGLAAGQRLGRRDTGFKRWQSRAANRIRAFVLSDGTRDTGCGLKAIRRPVYEALPYFDALHRFMPALVRREGLDIVYVDVVDRPRQSGHSNYGFFDRLWVGILDLAGVWWLIRRRRTVPVVMEMDER